MDRLAAALGASPAIGGLLGDGNGGAYGEGVGGCNIAQLVGGGGAAACVGGAPTGCSCKGSCGASAATCECVPVEVDGQTSAVVLVGECTADDVAVGGKPVMPRTRTHSERSAARDCTKSGSRIGVRQKLAHLHAPCCSPKPKSRRDDCGGVNSQWLYVAQSGERSDTSYVVVCDIRHERAHVYVAQGDQVYYAYSQHDRLR